MSTSPPLSYTIPRVAPTLTLSSYVPVMPVNTGIPVEWAMMTIAELGDILTDFTPDFTLGITLGIAGSGTNAAGTTGPVMSAVSTGNATVTPLTFQTGIVGSSGATAQSLGNALVLTTITAKLGQNASGADAAAGNFTISGPVSTGSATPGTLIFQTTSAGGSSSTAQTLATVLTLGAAAASVTGALSFTTLLASTTALATPSALAATAFNAFASTVSGATLMGFGTTNDVSLKNRAGTTVIGVGPNTTAVTLAGATTIAAGGLSMTAVSGNGIAIGAAVTADTLLYLSATAVFNSTVTLYGIYANPTFPATATTAGYVGYFKASTAASAFTQTNTYGVYVANASKGAASAITNQYGLYIEAISGGATLNIGAYIAGGGVQSVGTGFIVGTSAPGTSVAYNAESTTTLSGSTSQYGFKTNVTLGSGATSAGYGYYAQVNTAASSFTMTNAYGLYVDTLSKGASSAVTNNYGLYVNTASGGATLNYGIYVAGGTPALYIAAGGVQNNASDGRGYAYGAAPLTSSAFYSTGDAAGTSRYGLNVTNAWGSTTTVAGYGAYLGITTTAAGFTMTNMYGAYIDAVAKGAGSTITNRYGLYVVAPTDGATINHAIYSTGSIVSAGATQGIGYATGAGGAQTQGAGSGKGTTVVSNTVTTLITMNNAALNLLTIVSFTFTNSAIAATDHVIVEHQSAGTMGCYDCWCTPAGGSGTIYVKNISAGSLSEAIVIRATIIKAVSA